MTATLADLEYSLSFWELAGYVAFASVIICCLAEYLHVKEFWHKEGSWWTREGGSAAALLLVVALAFELLTQFRTNAVSGSIVAEQNTEAAITEKRLLGERRLTARERMRLERVERAVLPRSSFINWQQVVIDLKASHLKPVCVTSINRPEPRELASDIAMAFTEAGIPASFILKSTDPSVSEAIEPGITYTVVSPEDRLAAERLWQIFHTNANSVDATKFAPAWKEFPRNMPCVVVGESDAAFQGHPGQPGEGVDEYGGADPAPH